MKPKTIEQLAPKLLRDDNYNSRFQVILEGRDGMRAFTNGHILLANVEACPEHYQLRSIAKRNEGKIIEGEYPSFERVIPHNLDTTLHIPGDFYTYLKAFKPKRTGTPILKAVFTSKWIYVKDDINIDTENDNGLTDLHYADGLENWPFFFPFALNAYYLSILQPTIIAFNLMEKPFMIRIHGSLSYNVKVYPVGVIASCVLPEETI